MQLKTRKFINKLFSGTGIASVVIMTAFLLILLTPIAFRGLGAIFFTGTIEHRMLNCKEFGHGNREKIEKEFAKAKAAREPVYLQFDSFKKEVKNFDPEKRRELKSQLKEIKEFLKELLGPFPDEPTPVLLRNQYGQTRWKNAKEKFHHILYSEEWDYSDPDKPGVKLFIPRKKYFAKTSFESFFPYLEKNIKEMLLPEFTCYWQFLTDKSKDAHFFGGIMPEILGTIYLALGAMIFAVPLGILAAIYLSEYAKDSLFTRIIKLAIVNLSGVPSIVYGLFGLALFVMFLKIGTSILAGCLTLSLMSLPVIITATKEALESVPSYFREVSFSLGATRWQTIRYCVLPYALPGILTGSVLSLSRVAGETAPILFTVAAFYLPRLPHSIFDQVMTLPYHLYVISTQVPNMPLKVSFATALVLVILVFLMNLISIVLRIYFRRKKLW